MSAPFRVLVTGSRTWTDYSAILDALSEVASEHAAVVVVHGAAKGADSLAARAARELGLQTEPHPADWSAGRGAGYARNARMVQLGADLYLAFIKSGSRGASHCSTLADQAGIPGKYWRED
jgi:YspA, cpYpsA-related SLOG family